MKESDLSRLEEVMNRRIGALPTRIRPYTTGYGELPSSFILTGNRGCGKTTFLLHHATGRNMLYMSAESPIFATESLYDVVDFAFHQGYDGVIVDEVHFLDRWGFHIKALYDAWPGRMIWVSDSSSLILRFGGADLSRRLPSIQMPLLSFREFLFLEYGEIYPTYEFGSAEFPLQPTAKLLSAFRKYRQMGMLPYYQEGDFTERSLGVIDKIMYSDVPFFVKTVTENNQHLMRAIIGTLACSEVPRLQVRSLCSAWAVGPEKLYSLVNVLEAVGLLRVIRYQNDFKAMSVGAKMLFQDPNYYSLFSGKQGNEREAFIAACFGAAGFEVFANKNEEEGDFVVIDGKDKQQTLIEVGGRNKDVKNADWVFRDNSDYPSRKSLPFWLASMMW